MPTAGRLLTTDPALFRAATDAINTMLRDAGWNMVVAGPWRIEQQAGARPMNFEFVLRFTGGRVAQYGVCGACGCTDSTPCPGGCAWVDKTHRLCSACADRAARKRTKR